MAVDIYEILLTCATLNMCDNLAVGDVGINCVVEKRN